MATAPRASFVIDQNYLIEPLGGPQGVRTYLDGFPEEVYNKSIDSRLVRFLYSLLGPVGIGAVRRNYLEARLVYEAHGLELSSLDQFYGNPFQFGRIEDETYTENTLGLLPQDQWEKIRAKDARYRNRVIDFLAGARAGNTPFGMRLVARSGLGHEVEIIENYRHLYDSNSDDPLDLGYYGHTRLLNEMIVLPRQEVGVSEAQKITFLGAPTGGSFRIFLNGEYTEPIAFDATRQVTQTALEELSFVERGDIDVVGGPAPLVPLTVRFLGRLAERDIKQLVASNELTGTNPQITLTTVMQGFDASTETVDLSPADQYHLQVALDRIRPMTVIPTVAAASGVKSAISWIRASASSEFDEMLRYVTGSGNIVWPSRDEVHWIEGGIEHQAPRPHGELPYNYQAFHQVPAVDSYDGVAVADVNYLTAGWHDVKKSFASDHIGTYEPHHSAVFSFLRATDIDAVQTPDMALADYAEPLTVDRVIDIPGGSVSLVNGIYPSDYQSLAGAPAIRYRNEQFWSSRESISGDEYLELDLAQVRGINYLIFETSRKPITITIDYDRLGLGGERIWVPAADPITLPFSPIEQNPWNEIEFQLTNAKGEMIYARYLRIKFTRIINTSFLTAGSIKYPWSIDVCNLRVGRNVSNQ